MSPDAISRSGTWRYPKGTSTRYVLVPFNPITVRGAIGMSMTKDARTGVQPAGGAPVVEGDEDLLTSTVRDGMRALP